MIEESKRNDDQKKNALTKWNSNSTTPYCFNDGEDYQFSHNSSIFAEVENKNNEFPIKPNKKYHQSMLFKKKLNNVKKHSEYIKSKIILLLC